MKKMWALLISAGHFLFLHVFWQVGSLGVAVRPSRRER